MQKMETDFSKLYQLYSFEWAINDFLVTDEQYPIVEDLNIPGRGDTYLIGICLQGHIEVKLNSVSYTGSRNYMLIVKPFQLFQIYELSDDCRVRFIIFSKRFLIANDMNVQVLNKFQFLHPNALPVVAINNVEVNGIVKQFEIIWNRFNEIKHPFRKEVVGSLLLVLLHDFESVYIKDVHLLDITNTRAIEITKHFTELVQKNFRREHSVEFYAKKICVTSKYLTTTIKIITGRTTSAIIAEALSIEAQTLLQQPNISVKEAAHRLHFPDQSTFGKFFKRAVGVSPMKYKKKV